MTPCSQVCVSNMRFPSDVQTHFTFTNTLQIIQKNKKKKHVPWCDITMTGPLPGKYSTGILRYFQSCCIVPIPPHSSKKYQTKPWVKKKNQNTFKPTFKFPNHNWNNTCDWPEVILKNTINEKPRPYFFFCGDECQLINAPLCRLLLLGEKKIGQQKST